MKEPKMPVIEATSQAWAMCPKGNFQMVLVDVVDLGWRENMWEPEKGLEAQIRLVYQVNKRDDQGKRYLISAFVDPTKFMSDKSNMYRHMAATLGDDRAMEIVKTRRLNTDEMLGKNIYGKVTHKEKKSGGLRDVLDPMSSWDNTMGADLEPEDYKPTYMRESWNPPEHSAFGPRPGSTRPAVAPSSPSKTAASDNDDSDPFADE